ncbi:cell wall metabolism sensor histidine kinase WalK [SAR86 cluster bacterium]|nr:cell wall metabolism sensor histidine kinase WalK [SAR86 cluster bacterium]
MLNIFPKIRFSRIFLLSLSFLIFIIFIVSTIFSSFIYNNSRAQLVESLYMQAKSIDQLLPSFKQDFEYSYDLIADNLSVSDTKQNKLRVTIIDGNWDVLGDSEVPTNELINVEKHSPENRIEIKNALTNKFGTATRTSETTGQDLIYLAILRNSDDLTEGVIRVAMPFNIYTSFFNFFIYPFILLFVLAIVSSSIMTYSVESNIRRDLTKLLKNTERAIKGKPIKSSLTSDTQIEGLSKAVGDISIRLSSEIDQAMDQRTQFGSVLDSINQGVIIFSKNFRVRFTNDIALEMFGKHQFFLGEKIKSKKLSVINKILKDAKKNISSEDNLDIKVKGEDRNYLLTATKMETTNELILVINDISSMRKLEDLRKQFVTDVSHEIKTPISVIRAGSETLYSGAINDEKVSNRFLKSILDNSERLSEMVDDLMELEKIEFGGLVLKKEKFNVNNEIQLIFDAQQALLVDKKLSFNNYIGKDIFLNTDKESFRTVFSNLINNSIKYSKPEGFINLTAINNSEELSIRIEDNGHGIEKQHLDKIFNRFYRTSKARAHTKGTGLGLSLVKQLISRMNGEVRVESKISKGTSFFVRIPH